MNGFNLAIGVCYPKEGGLSSHDEWEQLKESNLMLSLCK